jgi:deoxyribonuclease IV
MPSHGPLGIHLSVGQKYDAAVAEAKRLGISCVQLFTHNPRGWQFAPLDEKAVAKFVKDLKALGISPIASHCNYLINLGTKDEEVRANSLACLKKEFEYAHAFGCSNFVLHVGKYKEGTLSDGIKNVAEGINALTDVMKKYPDVTLLLETVAGQGTEIGRDFRTFGEIINLLDTEIRGHVGVCLDTCHIFAAGYDIRTQKRMDAAVKAMDDAFGIGRLRFIHLNDSLKDVGEHRDRHVHIGQGFIGEAGFKTFLNHPVIRPIPKVLETPVDDEKGYEENLAVVRRLQI